MTPDYQPRLLAVTIGKGHTRPFLTKRLDTRLFQRLAGSEAAQQLREGLAEGAREYRNCIEPGLRTPTFHFDNCVFREAAMDGKIREAPAARLAQPFDALAEPHLKGLMFSGHPYRLSGTAQNRDSTTLVCIPSFWYDDLRGTGVAALTESRRYRPSRRSMKTGKNTSWRFYDADLIARRSTRFPARRPRRRLCSAAMQLATPLVDLLLDIFVWLFRIRDDAPGDLVFSSPIHTRLPRWDVPAGDGHA